ncbi:CAP domain-containing protein [Adlercreutzia muris]|nr:CAP domain-containing protein [Adlercreutzia muris]MCR2029238.1 CAP domain-containing protein [Adlercreutzia muris]
MMRALSERDGRGIGWRLVIAAFLGIVLAGAAPSIAWADETLGGSTEERASSIKGGAAEARAMPQAATPMTDALVVNVFRDYGQAYEVLALVNAERRAAGEAPLAMDQELLEAAMVRSVELSYYFDHTRPDGTDCWTAFPDTKGIVGENIAMMQSGPYQVMNSWMNSPGHRANILDSDFTTIGIGCVYVGNAGPYWVQCFGDGSAAAFAMPADRSFTTRCSIPTSWLQSGNFQFRQNYYSLLSGDSVQAEARFINQAPGAQSFVCELNPATFSWSTDKSAVATVGKTGVIAGRAPGITNVRAAIGDRVRISIPVEVQGDVGTWKKSGGRWWFSFDDGTYAHGWCQIDGDWYLFDSAGWMQTGWQKVGKSWYHLKPSGIMTTGWLKSGGSWYFMRGSGAMATGWVNDQGTWYYLNGSGAMTKGWQKIGKSWYYLKSSGAMATGWQKVGGSWYYLKGSGAMATGWQKIDGRWYHMQSSGAMDKARWIDGKYYVDGSGAMATDQWIGTYHVNGNGLWDKTR